ncbi:hypothetical protein N7528_006160 [Penicillium herquei]|nr:hypothetical protein N7528_006160 [Penicillium herquei]
MAPPVPIYQKHALQQWFKSQPSKPTLAKCRAWFFETFQRKISKSSITPILNQEIPPHLLNPKEGDKIQKHINPRGLVASWPLLDLALFEWQQRLQSQYNLTASGDMLKEQGQRIWDDIKHYFPDKKEPSFSNGWLERFKKRHNLRRVSKHGQIVSIPTSTDIEIEHIRLMGRVHVIHKQYDQVALARLKRLPVTLDQGLKHGEEFLYFMECQESTTPEELKMYSEYIQKLRQKVIGSTT